MAGKKTDRPSGRRSKKAKGEAAEGVRFQCCAPDAGSVALVGDFNDWDPEKNPMECCGEATWVARVPLGEGRFEYKFIVDGEWCCSPGCAPTMRCDTCVPNPFGTMNRVEVVEG